MTTDGLQDEIGTGAAIRPLAVLPVFFRLAGRRVVVAGGSEPAAWKTELLAAAGADVAVFAPEACERLAEIGRRWTTVRLHLRDWRPDDLDGAALAVAEGADPLAASAFVAAARSRGLPVNIIDRPALCDFSFGAIVNRSPLVVGLSTDGAAPVFAQRLRVLLEAALPPSLAQWAEAARDWRPRIAGLHLDFRRRRSFWERFADRALARDAPPAAGDFEALAENAGNLAATSLGGEIVIVGAGPGDPDLLTLRAARALQRADVILYGADVGTDVVELARREAQRIHVGVREDEAAALALRLAGEGKVVVRLEAGDFGASDRARQQLAAAQAAGVAANIVPGVAGTLHEAGGQS